MCECQRVNSVGGWSSIFAGIGSVARVVAPVVLPTAVAIGTEWAIGKIMPSPVANAPTVPGPLSSTDSEANAKQHAFNLSTTLGIVAVAGVAVYLLAKRR